MNMDMSTPIKLRNHLYKLSDFCTKKKFNNNFIPNFSIILLLILYREYNSIFDTE